MHNTDKTPKQRVAWTIGIALVVIYALIPVLWIASLSFKPTTDLHDGHFILRNWTLENYCGIFQTSEFTRALINSIGIGLFTTLLAVSLTSTEAARTAPAAMANFTGSSQFDEPTGSIAAAAIVITIPIVIFLVIFQRRVVAGLTSGAVKG